MSEYNERVYQLNFNLKEYLTLVAGGKRFHPVLTKLENIYGLDKRRKAMVVFSPERDSAELKNHEEYDIIFNDEIFDTGLNHFVFAGNDLNGIPELRIGE